MLWETKGNRRNTFCLHTHMFIIPNFHFSERDWVGSCSHHKRGIFLPDFAAFKAKRGGKRTSATAAARALAAAASGHRRAEEKRPGGAGSCPPFAHSRRESEGEKIAPDQVCEGRGAGEGPGPGRGRDAAGAQAGPALPAGAAGEFCPSLRRLLWLGRGSEGLPAATSRGRSGAASPTTAPCTGACAGKETRGARKMPQSPLQGRPGPGAARRGRRGLRWAGGCLRVRPTTSPGSVGRKRGRLFGFSGSTLGKISRDGAARERARCQAGEARQLRAGRTELG